MTGREISPTEWQAASLVARLLGGSAVPRDVLDAPPMTHDFDITVGDHVIALEVTAASDRDIVRQSAQAFKREWPAPSLANDWQIGVNRTFGEPMVDLNPVRKKIERILIVFEENGLIQVGAVALKSPPRMPGASRDVLDAVQEMFALGVTLARVHRPAARTGGALVLPSLHGGHGADADALNPLVVRDARSNAAKLKNAAADERHLFIWVDGSTPEVELALHVGRMPATPPEVQTGVDVVWVATLAAGGRFDRVIRVRPPADWEDLGTK